MRVVGPASTIASETGQNCEWMEEEEEEMRSFCGRSGREEGVHGTKLEPEPPKGRKYLVYKSILLNTIRVLNRHRHRHRHHRRHPSRYHRHRRRNRY